MSIRLYKLLGIPFLLFAIYLALPLSKPLFPDDYSTVVADADGQILRVFLNQRQQWHLPPRADLTIPAKLERAVLCFEDRRFLSHPGIDPLALARAVWQTLSSGRVVSGASTLTMQVTRLAQPKPRTLTNKLLEMGKALRVELRYTKEEILRLYLDHAPYGGNIVGYQAAALRYFGKSPDQLTWGEAATLAVLPNAPGLISPLTDTTRLQIRRDQLLRRLHHAGYLDVETLRLARLEPIPNRVRPFPLHAPHLARTLRPERGDWVSTTLKRPLQQRLEELVRQHLDYLQRQGIHNAAVLAAETESGLVRAYIGSQNFFDIETQGQVDGVRAPRSSGSLLKPFLYALSMDEGLVLPQTLIHDVPTYYGAFAPHNANRNYTGLVPVREALIHSLNVPAVRLLNAYGLYPFYLFLQEAGLSTLFRRADEYGLPLIIGGAEVTLWEMASLYRSLARGGRFTPLQVLTENPVDRQETRSISPGACYLTLEMLRQVHRPGAEYYWQQYQDRWPLAWKTGTSYGQRDAWAVGVNPQWTIAVWVGNFDGEGNAQLGGARSAGPLLFDIFNALPRDAENRWFTRADEDLVYAEICRDTGFLAGPHCEIKVEADAPRHMKPLPVCPYHRTVQVSEDETHQVCSLCWEPGDHHPVHRLDFPAEVAQHMRGRFGDRLPPHNPACPVQDDTHPLQITYPRENARLWLPRDLDGNRQQLVMRVAHRNADPNLFWYLDDRFIGNTRSHHTRAATVDRGWHTLEVVDATGYRDQSRFYVDRRE
ncbi:MAG: penicillin-binding protein 1C [Gemmatimonadetes bacterium]|jgi:penicillin-binding protein 1C|nr:penicillin-binding protein 1C [Gemmatimonadota bacterium]